MKLRTLCEIGCANGTDKCNVHGYHVPYEFHFGPLRNKTFTFLEIGVDRGASIRMWEEYFPAAKIIGVDINPECARTTLISNRSKIMVGNQSDPEFLKKVITESGGFDVVIDDGGHTMQQQQVSFLNLFPHVRANGFYIIEDLETSYSPSWGGGSIGSPNTTVAMGKSLVDDLNVRYHHGQLSAPAKVSALHFYSNIVFIVRA